MSKVIFKNGNREITLTVTDSNIWESGDKKRVYFNFTTSTRNPLNKIYEVLEGGTRDKILQINGRTFAYSYGVDSNSGLKRARIEEAMEELFSKLTA